MLNRQFSFSLGFKQSLIKRQFTRYESYEKILQTYAQNFKINQQRPFDHGISKNVYPLLPRPYSKTTSTNDSKRL